MRACSSLTAVLVAWALLTTACSGAGDGENGTGGTVGAAVSGSGTGGGSPLGTGGSVGIGGSVTSGPYDDFPADPILDDTATPSDAPNLFGDPGSGEMTGGPCLVEPEIGSLFPRNWLRPRFRWIPAAGQNLFELRLHTEAEVNDLVVYTTSSSWTMPKAMWTALSNHAVDVPITVTIRAGVFDGTMLVSPPALGSAGDVSIAPAEASGAIVYWTTTGNSALKGFKVGDESVLTVLIPDQVQMPTAGGAQVTCIGCHTSTPDGKYAGFTAQGPWSNALASIEPATTGAPPPFLSPAAVASLGKGQLGIQTFSKAHWTSGDYVEVAPSGSNANSELAWFDLETGADGVLARAGDPLGAGSPTWSHDGETIVYVSTDAELTGRLSEGIADLYSVPYGNRAGGIASPVTGASDASYSEYYPVFSADDALLAFNRIPPDEDMYNQPLAEVFVIDAAGGQPTRLAANDPPACTGKVSPGVTNSWPKWSPEATTIGQKAYYWIIFSSTRSEGHNPQLYISGVVVGPNGVETFPALYLWNQPANENNHTPAWDVFKIPEQPPE
jgi:hypothetical protein